MRKKKNKTEGTELEELFYRYKIQDKFTNDVLKMRKRFLLPKSGLLSYEEQDKWFDKNIIKKKLRKDILEAFDELQKKHKIPATLREYLEECVICDNRFTIFQNTPNTTCDIESETDIEVRKTEDMGITERMWRMSELPYVKIFISDYVNQTDVKKYIDANWKKVRELLDLQRGRARRKILPVQQKKLFKEIWDLNKKPRNQLCEKNEVYKTEAITRIINKKYKRKYKESTIKSMIARYSKLKKMQ